MPPERHQGLLEVRRQGGFAFDEALPARMLKPKSMRVQGLPRHEQLICLGG
jgi:hypothetical protein